MRYWRETGSDKDRRGNYQTVGSSSENIVEQRLERATREEEEYMIGLEQEL